MNAGIPADALAARFRGILGWRYESPGTNDARGIDCSGAFVWAFAAFGRKIAHGSNSIFRKHTVRTFEIARAGGAAALAVGMAVFKRRESGGEPARWRGDGIGDMYHIGLVCGVDPLVIVHATPPRAKADARLGAWTWAGTLKGVAYAGARGATAETPAAREAAAVSPTAAHGAGFENEKEGMRMQSAVVTAMSGNTVNLRCGPSRNATVRMRVPVGKRISVMRLMEGGAWAQVGSEGITGYMMTEFLAFEGGTGTGTEDGGGTGAGAEGGAEAVKGDAEAAKGGAERVRAFVEAASVDAEATRGCAEAASADAERVRAIAEAASADAEAARGCVEAASADAERVRAFAEAVTVDAEATRGCAETATADAERVRAIAEAASVDAELIRNTVGIASFDAESLLAAMSALRERMEALECAVFGEDGEPDETGTSDEYGNSDGDGASATSGDLIDAAASGETQPPQAEEVHA